VPDRKRAAGGRERDRYQDWLADRLAGSLLNPGTD
jgi:hypothetical protein